MTRDEIASRIPHAGRMCLLDQALAWDADRIHCRSDNHRAADHPLRRRGQLASVNLVEYAAQAAALHSALVDADQAGGRAGMLAGLKDVWLAGGDLQDVAQALDIHAEREMASPLGLIYRFDVQAGPAPLAKGRLTIITAQANPNG